MKHWRLFKRKRLKNSTVQREKEVKSSISYSSLKLLPPPMDGCENIGIGIPTPWGMTLSFVLVHNFPSTNMDEYFSHSHIVVRTSKEKYGQPFRFHLEPYSQNTREKSRRTK